MPIWIKSRDVNGNYGYRNLETGEFRTTIPGSTQEKQQSKAKLNKAVLKTHSTRQAKFDNTEAKRRNHSDETQKKVIRRPILKANRKGEIKNDYSVELAPSEQSLGSTDPIGEFIVAGTALNKPIQLIGKGITYGLARAGDQWARSKIISSKLNTLIDQNPIFNFNKIRGGASDLFHVPSREYFAKDRMVPQNNGYIWWSRRRPFREDGNEVTPIYKLENNNRIVGSGDLEGVSKNVDRSYPLTKDIPYTETTMFDPFILPRTLYNKYGFPYERRNLGYVKTQFRKTLNDPIDNDTHQIRLLHTPITTKKYTYFDKTNSDDNSAIYHLQRLLHGGFSKVKSQGDITSDFPIRIYQLPKQRREAYNEILNRAGNQVSTKEINQVLDDIFYRGASIDYNNKPLGIVLTDSPNFYSNVISHELDHAAHIPSQFPKGFNRNASDYFLEDNGSELAARGSQIKDYFKLTDSNQSITEDMLKYASQNYVKDTGIDNDMTEFFNNIIDWKEAAKWLSKYSTSIVAPTLGVTFPSIEVYDKQKGN